MKYNTLYTFFSACSAESRCVGFGGSHRGYLIGSVVGASAHREAVNVSTDGLD